MAAIDDVKAEILRLRDRLHDVESKLVGIELLISDLREWRAEVRTQLRAINSKLESLVSAEAIAEAVAEALKQEQREEDDNRVTIGNLKVARWQVRLGVAGLAAAILSPYIQDVVQSVQRAHG